jgi:hypothetical protein
VTTTNARRWVWRAEFLITGVLLAAVLLSGPWRFLLGSVTGSPALAYRSAPCLPGQEVPIMDSPHVSPATLETVRYNSVPPTSGPHYAFTVAPGIYSEPLSPGLTVHAMEHGHIVVQYAPDTPKPTVRLLEHLAKRYAADIVLAPYPGLDHGIALTAWGRIDIMTRYDEHRASDFVERLRNRYVHGWTRPDDCAGGR